MRMPSFKLAPSDSWASPEFIRVAASPIPATPSAFCQWIFCAENTSADSRF